MAQEEFKFTWEEWHLIVVGAQSYLVDVDPELLRKVDVVESALIENIDTSRAIVKVKSE